MGQARRRWVERVAWVLVPAVVGAGTVIALRRGDDETPPDTGGSGPSALTALEIGPSGLVVELTRSGADLPVALGSTAAFRVGVAAARAVDHIELWQDDTVAATYEPPSGRLDVGARLEWAPVDGGPHLIMARAIDTSGRVGMSNPLWLDVTEAPEIQMFADGADVATPTNQSTGFANPSMAPDEHGIRAFAGAGAFDGVRPTPSPPTLALTNDGCTTNLTAAAAGAGRLMLFDVPPGGRTLQPVAEFATGSNARASMSTVLGAGTQAFMVAEVVDGLVTDWSAPVITTVADGCSPPGWDGTIALADGRLQTGAGVSEAYLYVESSPNTWIRVPESGTVARTAAGFDFSPYLPPIAGEYSVHAWGWGGGALQLIGEGMFAPPSSSDVVSPQGGNLIITGPYLPPATLRWVRHPHRGYLDEVLTTSGKIDVDPDDDVLGAEQFRWSVPYLGVTHAVVQVSLEPIPSNQGPTTPVSMFSCIVPGSGGDFEIDFDNGTCIAEGQQGVTNISSGDSQYGSLVFSQAGVPFDSQDLVSEVDPLAEIEKQIYSDPESPPAADLPWVEHRVVRVLPMTSDAWGGAVSNDVSIEIDRTPKAPPGEFAYDLDLELVTAPRAPLLQYSNCWQVTGWQDPDAAAAAAAAELAELQTQQQSNQQITVLPNSVFQPHYWWTEFVKSNPGPICAVGCYPTSFTGLTGAMVSFGGADCGTGSSFLDDPVGWVIENVAGPIVAVIKEFVNLISNGFAQLKGLAVDGLMQITGCTGKFCKVLAEAVVNGALLAIGVPPTLPNFDQLVQTLKGDLIDVAVDLASSAGVPCDEVSTVADFSDQPDLTCEAAIEALIDQVAAAVNQNFVDLAKSGGIDFPDDLNIKPWWAGQPGPAEIKVTVKPTKYTAEEQGTTCSAGVLSSATWTAPSATQSIPGVGTAIIPQTHWQGQAYEIVNWQLPDLDASGGYQPVTKTFELYPTVGYDMVTVQQQVPTLTGPTSIPVKVSPYTFYFHQGATFAFNVAGSCARGETRTYTIGGGLVSVVEG